MEITFAFPVKFFINKFMSINHITNIIPTKDRAK